jgi:hypothetical protein
VPRVSEGCVRLVQREITRAPTICEVWLRRSAGTRPIKLCERERQRAPSGRPRSYHPLGIRREVTVRAFARCCAIEVFATRTDALHIVGRRSLEA